MKVIGVKRISRQSSLPVLDCAVESGFWKVAHGSLPDIDVDFDSSQRPRVKEYLEKRYNHDGMQRVFSAGTFTTEKIKGIMKDIARTHKISVGTTNYITAMLEDDSMSWTDLMALAFENKKIADYIQKNYEVFEEAVPLMLQPRAAGIHASALIITPEHIKGKKVECFDVLPIRKMNGLLVSEISGADIDDIGLLKNDVLGIAELTRMADMISICNEHFGANLSIESILAGDLNDPLVYKHLRAGLTQGVFQLSGFGMTRFIKQMKPDCINDLIVSVAIFRPGTLESGAAQAYCDAKAGMVEPVYLWGTYDILKNTFGQIIYQEQVSEIAKKIGGLSLGDGVKLVKALSKKKLEKVRKFQEKFFEGAKKNGSPPEVAKKIWEDTESASKYLFNLSHATAYGLTAFIGAYLKVHYPIAFYTVMLQWADTEDLPTLMNEMREIGNAKISNPDINISGENFVTDYETNTIYWSISKIRDIGAAKVKYILENRNALGPFKSMSDFIKRLYKNKFREKGGKAEKVPVNSITIKNLIMAGAFDKLEGVCSVTERYGLVCKAAELLGFKINPSQFPEEMVAKHYFWEQRQVKLTGFGHIDYKRIYDCFDKPEKVKRYAYWNFESLLKLLRVENFSCVICASVMDFTEKTYKSKKDGTTKHFGKITLRQNTDIMQLVVWDDSWHEFKTDLMVDKILIAVVNVKYSDYDERNNLQLSRTAYAEFI